MPYSARSASHRKFLWTLGLLVLPLLVVGVDALQSWGAGAGMNGAARYAAMLGTMVLYGAVAFLVDRGLRIFVWEDAYSRLRGDTAPRVLQGAASVITYSIAVVLVLSSILNLDTSTVLISTGLAAGVLGVALRNTISGEMSMLTGDAHYSRAEAATNVRLIEIPKASFAPILAGNERLRDCLADIAAARRSQSEALERAVDEPSRSGVLSAEADWLKAKISNFFGYRE